MFHFKSVLILLICVSTGIAPNTAFKLPSIDIDKNVYEYAHFQAIDRGAVIIVKFSSTTDVDFSQAHSDVQSALAASERTWTLTKKMIVNELVGMIRNNTGFAIKPSGIAQFYKAVMTARGLDRDAIEDTHMTDKIMWFLSELSSVKPDLDIVEVYSQLYPDTRKQYFVSHMFRISIPTTVRAHDLSSFFDHEGALELFVRVVKSAVIASKVSSEEFDRFIDKHIPIVLRYIVNEIANKPKDKADFILFAYNDIPFPIFSSEGSDQFHEGFRRDNPVFVVFGRNQEDQTSISDRSVTTPAPSRGFFSDFSLTDVESFEHGRLQAVRSGNLVIVRNRLGPLGRLVNWPIVMGSGGLQKERSWTLMRKLIINELQGMYRNNTGFVITGDGVSKFYDMVMTSREVDRNAIRHATVSDKINWFLRELNDVKSDMILTQIYSSFFPDTNKQYFISSVLRKIAGAAIMIDKYTPGYFGTETGIAKYIDMFGEQLSQDGTKELRQFCDQYLPTLVRYVIRELFGEPGNLDIDVFSVSAEILYPYDSKGKNDKDIARLSPAEIAFGKKDEEGGRDD